MTTLETLQDQAGKRTIRLVAVSGSLHVPSSTTLLVRHMLDALSAAVHARGVSVEASVVELVDVGPALAGALSREQLGTTTEGRAALAALLAVEDADFLIAGTPVYRASFTGLFKHFFDFVDQYALVDTPVLLAATGGSDRHALTIEHQLRPLFSFFQALTLPIGVYAASRDFSEGRVACPDLAERIDRAVARAVPFVAGHEPDGGRRPVW